MHTFCSIYAETVPVVLYDLFQINTTKIRQSRANENGQIWFFFVETVHLS